MASTNFMLWDARYKGAAIDLYIAVFSQEPWNDILTREEIVLYFDRMLAMNTFEGYLLVDGDTLVAVSVGFVRPWFRGVQYHLDSFYIAQGYQGQGVGSLFLDAIKDDLAKKDVPNIALDTEVGFPAEFFYRKNGFSSSADSVTMYCGTKPRKDVAE